MHLLLIKSTQSVSGYRGIARIRYLEREAQFPHRFATSVPPSHAASVDYVSSMLKEIFETNLRPREYEAEVPCDNSSQTPKLSFSVQIASFPQ